MIVNSLPVKMKEPVLTKWTAICVHVSKGSMALIVRQVCTNNEITLYTCTK
jgi:hypothetical protein